MHMIIQITGYDDSINIGLISTKLIKNINKVIHVIIGDIANTWRNNFINTRNNCGFFTFISMLL